ncbi:MAG: hypothetical protein ACI350_01570 [Prevotella sp.]
MASRKDLKRTINLMCSALFAECTAAYLYTGNIKQEDANNLLASIVRIHSDYISRISHVEPGIPAKKYFRAIIDQFNQQISEIIDQIANLN